MNNIEQLPKENCTGCGACMQICPKQCIDMTRSEEGFLYPKTDKNKCIECRKCLKVCPAYDRLSTRIPIACFGAYNKNDDLRLKSSSGGIFIEIASYVIERGGVVFGVVFNDEWLPIHVSAKTLDEVYPMMGSKYVQSDTLFTYKECRDYLNSGRLVLYSGTPCQIAGLNKFLGKSYENLITIEIVCHGVPSPLYWQEYLSDIRSHNACKIPQCNTELVKRQDIIGNIKFRDKRAGWKKFSLVISTSKDFEIEENILYKNTFDQDIFMRGFLNDLYLRQSCYKCPAKEFRSQSDFTLGDFWGVFKGLLQDYDDDRGFSLVTANTEKAHNICKILSSSTYFIPISYSDAIKSNENIVFQQKKNVDKIKNFRTVYKTENFISAVNKTLYISPIKAILNKFKWHLAKFMN